MSRSFFCNILLPRQITFTAGDIGRGVRKLAPEANDLIMECPSGMDTPGPTLITLNGDDFAILNMSFPVPSGEYDATLVNNFIWPDDRQALASHNAHVIVQTMFEIDSRSAALKAARKLTLVVGALVEIGKAVAVYWMSADNFWRADLFPAQVGAMVKGERLPVELWVRVYLDQKEDASGQLLTAVASRGLAAFVDREVQIDYCDLTPDVLVATLLTTAHMLIERDLEFKDGETIGTQEDGPGFEIRLQTSGALGLGPIYALSAPR